MRNAGQVDEDTPHAHRICTLRAHHGRTQVVLRPEITLLAGEALLPGDRCIGKLPFAAAAELESLRAAGKANMKTSELQTLQTRTLQTRHLQLQCEPPLACSPATARPATARSSSAPL